MITYSVSKANYCELWGLSTDTKPTGIGEVPNGSLFTEIDTKKTYRFNGEAGDWFDNSAKYPTKLEVVEGAYKVTYSDTTSSDDIDVTLDGETAYYTENTITVSCDAIQVSVTITGDVVTATYDGEEHTATGYSAEADNSAIFTVATDIEYLGEGTPSVSRAEVGKSMMGLSIDDFENKNHQCVVTITVTDGYVEIEAEPESEPSDEPENNSKGVNRKK